MKKILVPTDFSKTAQLAVDVGADIAKKADAELILLHVIEEPSQTSLNITGEVDLSEAWEDKIFTLKLIERSKKQMAKLVDKLKGNGLSVKPEMRMGTPFYGMRDIIAGHMVDLVVMGTEGRSKIEEMIIGSNTEKVIRHAKCPVLTVHKKPATTDFRNIVYATSMAKDEKVFSGIIRCTQELYDATVHLLRINTPGNFQRDVVIRKHMQDFANKLRLKKFTINIFNDLTEEEGIIYFADSVNADLIAMATHGRTGFAHLLAGSIAEDVVFHSRRPVLTFITD
jgi:nucleotide-binding universal stress UspA family protein